MAKLLFYHCQITNSRLKKKKFYLDLLVQSWNKSSLRVTNPITADIRNSVLIMSCTTWGSSREI